jgi:glycerate kinase
MLGDGRTAVIEMADASGLALVPLGERDPSKTTTRGTGELVLAAIDAGARRIILGIGGSATNDAGAGLAQALGFRLLDQHERELPPGGGELHQLYKIDASGVDRRIEGVAVDVACDVDNPLCGPAGASVVYGPQKGASPEMVESLDRNLGHFADVVARDLGLSVRNLPGAGAAGGLGAGLVAFVGGRLEPGVFVVSRAVRLGDRLRDADLCVSGEGAIDASSTFGKTAVGVAREAQSVGCPTILLCGTIAQTADAVLDCGVDAIFSLCTGPMSRAEAIADAAGLLERVAAHAVRCFLAGRNSSARLR